jgi:hypothetical protein
LQGEVRDSSGSVGYNNHQESEESKNEEEAMEELGNKVVIISRF